MTGCGTAAQSIMFFPRWMDSGEAITGLPTLPTTPNVELSSRFLLQRPYGWCKSQTGLARVVFLVFPGRTVAGNNCTVVATDRGTRFFITPLLQFAVTLTTGCNSR